MKSSYKFFAYLLFVVFVLAFIFAFVNSSVESFKEGKTNWKRVGVCVGTQGKIC